MGIFTTREIAILIYAIVLLIYILIHKKAKSILLPVIKAACEIKLIIPFFIIISFAALFTWGCTYLPFWNWVYVKDIIFWTLFAGVPVCFNAASRKIEEHYFRNIIIDNLKFAALVEFFTGTFTFHIILELILQPLLVIFMILQSTLIKKSERVKKAIDGIVGVLGLGILVLTIKSLFDSIDSILLIDILVSFTLPIVLSSLYLPVAYFLAVFSKYEILFLRMKSKEPNDKKLRRGHRYEVIRCCKLSYKKVCRFLNNYVKEMYIKMSPIEFESLVNKFRDTNEHTYYAAIKHNGMYYVSKKLTSNSKFAFHKLTVNKGGLFKNSNKELRKEIAIQIQNETSFKSTELGTNSTCRPVCLKKFLTFNKKTGFKITKIAIFRSNVIEESTDTINLLFADNIREHCDKITLKLMSKLKWNNIRVAFFTVLIYFTSFILASILPNDLCVDLDLAAFIFAVISLLHTLLNCTSIKKIKAFKNLSNLLEWLHLGGILEIIFVIISLLLAYFLQSFDINDSFLSKLGIAIIFSDVLVDMFRRDQ